MPNCSLLSLLHRQLKVELERFALETNKACFAYKFDRVFRAMSIPYELDPVQLS